MKVQIMTVAQIERAVNTLQEVQQRNKPESMEWQAASHLLGELFDELHRRETETGKRILIRLN